MSVLIGGPNGRLAFMLILLKYRNYYYYNIPSSTWSTMVMSPVTFSSDTVEYMVSIGLHVLEKILL